jgi:hypothetical protein
MLLFGLFSLWGTGGQVKFGSVLRCAEHVKTSHCMAADDEQTEVVEFVNQHLPRAETVFVGNTHHDKIYVNDASLYFLLGRPIPVKWNEMHPGVVTTEPVQKAMIQQIEQRRVKLIVLAAMPDSSEANASAASSQVHALDDYIKRNYRQVFSNRRYAALQRITVFDPD